MPRETFVWDREAEKLVPAAEYYARKYAGVGQGPQIMRDISPYRNVIDGKEIGSRSTHREFLKRNNVVEVGNDKPKLGKRELPEVPGLRDELKRALQKAESK